MKLNTYEVVRRMTVEAESAEEAGAKAMDIQTNFPLLAPEFEVVDVDGRVLVVTFKSPPRTF